MPARPMPEMGTHEWYDTVGNISGRLNWLRAAVMGANDGIVSVAGLVIGVAGANASASTLLTAGVAGISAGAMSMAVGEYVSVSSQRDSERGMLALEREELAKIPEQELTELAGILQRLGMEQETALTAATEIHAKDPFPAHAQLELGLDPEEQVNPMEAGLASAVAFLVGGLVPLLAVLLAPHEMAAVAVAVAVVLALVLTGAVSARLGRSGVTRAVVRNVLGGILAMAITFGIGRLFGTAVG